MGYGNPYLQNCTNLWLSALDQGFTCTGPAWTRVSSGACLDKVSLVRGLDKGFTCTRHALWAPLNSLMGSLMVAFKFPYEIPYGCP